MRAVLKYGSQWAIAFAGIWTALYTSGTLEKVIPEWVGPDPEPIAEELVARGDSLFFTSFPVFEEPDPDVWPLVALMVGTVVAAMLIVLVISRFRG